MNKQTNKQRLLIFAALTTFFFVTLFFSSVSAQNPKVLDDLTARNLGAAASLVRNYVSISEKERNRQTFFSNLTPREKSSLVRFHLAMQIAQRPHLSEEQKSLILDSLSGIDGRGYDLRGTDIGDEARSKADEIQERAKEVFSKYEGAEIFGKVGGDNMAISLLGKYRDVVTVQSMCERRELFKNLTSTEKSNVWKVQLALALAQGENFSREQQSLIVEAIKVLAPELYLVSSDEQNRKRISEFLSGMSKRAVELFGKPTAAKVFAIIGTDDPLPLEGTDCSCSISSNWCAGECSRIGSTCDITESGCGTFWLYSCNGRCLFSNSQ
ncbi:MAG: bacteriocin fulvocin C-related protein [Pyrinomonadaceae bacterium]